MNMTSGVLNIEDSKAGSAKPQAAGAGARQTMALVVPVFNEEVNLAELCRRVKAACDSVENLDWQMIMVDDGSRDSTALLAREQHAKDPRFHLLQLSRNFGHQAAITAGLAHADADAVIIMDADLQDPPELIPELIQAWRDGGQVVLAQRKSRAERGLRRLGFDLFHKFFKWLSDFPIPSQTGVFGLMDRAAHQQMVRLTERNRFIPGLRSWIGFEQRTVFYDRQDRAAGEPKQTFKRLIKYAMDGVFSFSYKPLRLMTWFGTIIAFIGFATASFFVAKRLFFGDTAVTGFTTLLCMMMLLGGVQLIALGLIGEYLGRIYDEVKNRPLFIVKSFTGDTETLSDSVKASHERPTMKASP
ncbi:MAG: glycosyltransferase family 2 protein [Phycisphaeraceae bacterium]